MTRYLLDTSVLIDFSRSVRPVQERLRALANEGHELGVCGVNITEFYSGVPRGAKPAIDAFIDALRYWEIDRAAFLIAGAYRYSFARQGVTLASPDTIIAAVALGQRASILTDNVKHFPMNDVVVERLGP